jgi:hypothetical protein
VSNGSTSPPQHSTNERPTTTLHKRTSEVAAHLEEAKFEGQALWFEGGPKRFISSFFYLTASVAFES